MASFVLLFGLAGTSGVPAELLILVSAIQTHPGAGLAALFGMVLGAACFLGPYRRAFFGPVTNPVVREIVDLRLRELAIAAAPGIIVVAVGLNPAMVLDVIESAARARILRLG